MLMQTGKALTKAIVEAGDEVGWIVFQVANINQHLKRWVVAPHIGATKMSMAQDFNGFI
jgi:hypothetical protein